MYITSRLPDGLTRAERSKYLVHQGIFGIGFAVHVQKKTYSPAKTPCIIIIVPWRSTCLFFGPKSQGTLWTVSQLTHSNYARKRHCLVSHRFVRPPMISLSLRLKSLAVMNENAQALAKTALPAGHLSTRLWYIMWFVLSSKLVPPVVVRDKHFTRLAILSETRQFLFAFLSSEVFWFEWLILRLVLWSFCCETLTSSVEDLICNPIGHAQFLLPCFCFCLNWQKLELVWLS